MRARRAEILRYFHFCACPLGCSEALPARRVPEIQSSKPAASSAAASEAAAASARGVGVGGREISAGAIDGISFPVKLHRKERVPYIRIHRGTHHVARDYARCASIHMASCSQSPKQLPAPPLHLRRSMRQIGSRASRCRETRSEYHASCCVRACVHVRLYFW